MPEENGHKKRLTSFEMSRFILCYFTGVSADTAIVSQPSLVPAAIS